MLTFSTRAVFSSDALYRAIEKKAAGAIRSAISNCSQASQTVLAKALAADTIQGERKQKKAILESRAARAHAVLSKPEFADCWEPYPFNAGYFMCLKLKGLDADTFRKHLLEKYGVGVIADGDRDIRVAFSAVEESELEDLYGLMATAARELLQGGVPAKG